jgi:hypothetical protein
MRGNVCYDAERVDVRIAKHKHEFTQLGHWYALGTADIDSSQQRDEATHA